MPALFGAFPHYLEEVVLALAPILAVFAIFQIFWLKLPARRLLRMVAGIVYTLVGLFLFLAAVNTGFLPVGYALGGQLASLGANWVLIPLAMLMGFFIVRAEPAVHVLNAQVSEITDGVISKRAMMTTLSLGIAASLGLAMIRILTSLSIWWFVLPGYALALGMSFFVPPVFTAIAFDSGGVASGPMTATFLLPFALGAVDALGGNPMADAFGLVAMVAMTPLIAIQSLALVYAFKTRKLEKPPPSVQRRRSSTSIRGAYGKIEIDCGHRGSWPGRAHEPCARGCGLCRLFPPLRTGHGQGRLDGIPRPYGYAPGRVARPLRGGKDKRRPRRPASGAGGGALFRRHRPVQQHRRARYLRPARQRRERPWIRALI